MSKSSGRRQRKKDQTRRAIAEAAMRLFLEQGFEKVTVAQIADAADVSVNTVFNYFPTKEAIFLGCASTGEAGLDPPKISREPHESVVAFLRRLLEDAIERCANKSVSLAEFAFLAGVRRVFLESPALQVYADHAARRASDDREGAFSQALARDVKAGASDLTPQLVTAQVFAIYSTLILEADRRTRAGEKPDKIQAILSAAAKRSLELLEKGIGDYGVKRM